MPHRIILTGRNKNFPKTVSMPLGFAVDGSVISKHIQIAADQCKCQRCAGWGTVETWDGNPSHRAVAERCTACDGEGIATVRAA